MGVNVFVALSLLTSIFDGPFPAAVPYVFHMAALAGFGQIWVNYAFLFFLLRHVSGLACFTLLWL